MANRSLLCGARACHIQPRNWDDSFDLEDQIIANDVVGVPALWFALFRPKDIQAKIFDTEVGAFHVEAPIASREDALLQLADSVEVLSAAFADMGRIDEYVSFLEEAIASSDWPFVTIEMEEIAFCVDSQDFYHDVRLLLSKLERKDPEGIIDLLYGLSSFIELTALPSARFALDSLDDESGHDTWNHCRMIGAGRLNSGIGREVPWEPRDA